MSARASIMLVLVFVACARHGQSREGAVPVTDELSLRPAADNLVVTWDLVHAIEVRQASQDELLIDRDGARIDFDSTRIYSDRFPPIDVPLVSAARRELLEEAVAAVRGEAQVLPRQIHTVVERDKDKWLLRFVDTSDGFDLEPGTLAKIGEPEPGADAGVVLFLTELDATRFEALTRAYEGRRISMIAGDESLMTPVVEAVIPGGIVWINPGHGAAEDLLARLVK